MGLRDQALAATVDSAAHALAQQKDSDAEDTSRFVAKLRDYFGSEPVTPLSYLRGEHPQLYSERFGGEHVRWMPHRLARAEVGGVIFVDAVTYAQAHIEVACSDCQQPAYASLGEEPWRYKPDEAVYEYVRRPEHRADFLVKIGEALTRPTLCWNCRTQVPRHCPTCGRSNP